MVLTNPQWPDVQLHLEKIALIVNAATPGSYAEVDIPMRPKRKPGLQL